MKKSMYSTDTVWYDEYIYNAITALDDKYPNAIPVFGGALGAYNSVNTDKPDFAKFVSYIPDVVYSAKFYNWHEGTVGAIRRFCRLCLVDPALVELYLGISLAELTD